jgi:hypothetical protein
MGGPGKLGDRYRWRADADFRGWNHTGKGPETTKENAMMTHPYLLGFSAKQHTDQLMAEAEHERVLNAALRRRRQARAAARNARHQAANEISTATPAGASVKAANMRDVSAGSPRERFASQPAPATTTGPVSEAGGSLSACEPPAAA